MATRARRLQLLANLERKYGLPRGMLYGQWGAESGFSEGGGSRSSAGALGPFQFMPATAASMGVNPHNFASAAKGAARYDAQYKDRGFDGILAAYNAGPAGNPNNPETQGYIKRVREYASKAPYGGGGGALPAGAPQLDEPATKSAFDQQGFGDARRQFVLGQLLQRVDSPFKPQRRSSLLSFLPQEAPAREDYTSAVASMRRMAGGLKVAEPGGVGKMPRGGGYAGTEAIVKQLADPVAGRFGIRASNYKRDPEHNAAVGGSPTSDHLTTNTNSYAADYPATGRTGAQLASRLAKRLGIRDYRPGTFNRYTVRIGRRTFTAQILWGVEGHHDHVHLGLQAA